MKQFWIRSGPGPDPHPEGKLNREPIQTTQQQSYSLIMPAKNLDTDTIH